MFRNMFRTICLSIALAYAPGFPVMAQTDVRGICVVLSVEGASVVSAPGNGRRAAEVGLGLGRGATLRTEHNARVTLQCDSELRVVVGPASEIAVARLVDDAQQTFGMRLMQGIAGFFSDGDDTGETIQIRTPSAVAAVRSTEWAMRVTEGASAVFAREGAVFVFGETETVQLGPGDGVDVTADGTVGSVVQWGQLRIDRFAELLGPDW